MKKPSKFSPEVRDRAVKLLTARPIGQRAKTQPSELSCGGQQRVSIARALANRPPVILADAQAGLGWSGGGPQPTQRLTFRQNRFER